MISTAKIGRQPRDQPSFFHRSQSSPSSSSPQHDTNSRRLLLQYTTAARQNIYSALPPKSQIHSFLPISQNSLPASSSARTHIGRKLFSYNATQRIPHFGLQDTQETGRSYTMASQAAQFAETIANLKRAVKRNAYGSYYITTRT